MRVKMNDPIRWPDGTIATPREMLNAGKAEVRVCEKFKARSSSTPRRAVFVDLIGTMTGVEVSGYVAKP